MYRKLFLAVALTGISAGSAVAQQQALPAAPGVLVPQNPTFMPGRIVQFNGNTLYFQPWMAQRQQYGVVQPFQVSPSNRQVIPLQGQEQPAVIGSVNTAVSPNTAPYGLRWAVPMQGQSVIGASPMNQPALPKLNPSPNLSLPGRNVRWSGINNPFTVLPPRPGTTGPGGPGTWGTTVPGNPRLSGPPYPRLPGALSVPGTPGGR
jgi:hypothetical protein